MSFPLPNQQTQSTDPSPKFNSLHSSPEGTDVATFKPTFHRQYLGCYSTVKPVKVCVPFISRILRAEQNRKIRGRKYWHDTNYNSHSTLSWNCVVWTRSAKQRRKIILHVKLATFMAAKLEGFTVFDRTIIINTRTTTISIHHPPPVKQCNSPYQHHLGWHHDHVLVWSPSQSTHGWPACKLADRSPSGRHHWSRGSL